MGGSWRPIFWENVDPIGPTCSQNMGLHLLPNLPSQANFAVTRYITTRRNNHTTTKNARFQLSFGGSWRLHILGKCWPNWTNMFPKYGPPTPSQSSQPSKSTPGFTCRWLQTHQ